jgi:glycosyltransferase involved in cell wall biosynthesis
MIRVTVLLSTHNGEQHLAEQIESILGQQDVDVRLLVRDDGSTDSTVKIVQRYMRARDTISLIQGDNIGYAESFMYLARRAEDSDFYAFSDQDDVWFADKCAAAVSALSGLPTDPPRGRMYFSNAERVTTNLQPLGPIYSRYWAPPHRFRWLTESHAHGFTIVFDKSAMELIRRYKGFAYLPHDYLIPMILGFTSTITYDNESHALWRRHSCAIGSKRVNRVMRFLRRFHEDRKKSFAEQGAQLLLAQYNDVLEERDRNFLKTVSLYKRNLRAKMALLRMRELMRETWRETLISQMRIAVSVY